MGGEGVDLICLGAGLVIGGVAIMLVSYHAGGPAALTDIGKILAFLGFVIYVVGRIRYQRTKKAGLQPDTPDHKGGP